MRVARFRIRNYVSAANHFHGSSIISVSLPATWINFQRGCMQCFNTCSYARSRSDECRHREIKEDNMNDVEDADDLFPQLRNCASSFEFVLNEG